MNNFAELGLRPELLKAVSGYEAPTPIQTQAIPHLLNGRDVMGQAQTGTGKTAAFALPMLQLLDDSVRGVQAIILTPTRELAMQVSQAVFEYGTPMGVSVLPIYGGQSYTRQIGRLKRGTHIVVGTPGRTLDLIKQGALRLDEVRFLVLDEADEMLKMGFIDDVETIMKATPTTRQTALFSATLSDRIRKLAAKYMDRPIEVTIEDKTRTVEAIDQRYHLVQERDKLNALALVLEAESINSVLIFTRTRVGADDLAEQLLARGYAAEALHGDLSQAVRETVLRRFRNGDLRILIGTDVVARGVDIPDVSHVINYDLPMRGEEYVHRIGRTGRAGRAGVAISLVTPGAVRDLKLIQHYTKQIIARKTLPTPEQVYYQRDVRFADELDSMLESEELKDEFSLVAELISAGFEPAELAAAAIAMARSVEKRRPVQAVYEAQPKKQVHERSVKGGSNNKKKRHEQEKGMVKLRMALGHQHGIRPGEIVGTVAGTAGIPGKSIGAIDIQSNETYFDVKSQVVDQVVSKMKSSKLRGVSLNVSRV